MFQTIPNQICLGNSIRSSNWLAIVGNMNTPRLGSSIPHSLGAIYARAALTTSPTSESRPRHLQAKFPQAIFQSLDLAFLWNSENVTFFSNTQQNANIL